MGFGGSTFSKLNGGFWKGKVDFIAFLPEVSVLFRFAVEGGVGAVWSCETKKKKE